MIGLEAQTNKNGRTCARPFCDAAVGMSRLREHVLDMAPIDQIVDEGLEIFGSEIAIIDIIAMLPHIDAEDRLGAVHQRVLAIGRLHYGKLAILYRDPGPARTEL